MRGANPTDRCRSAVVFAGAGAVQRTTSAIGEDGDFLQGEEARVGGDQSEIEHFRRGDEKSVGGIAMRQSDGGKGGNDVVGQRRFLHRKFRERARDPGSRVRALQAPDGSPLLRTMGVLALTSSLSFHLRTIARPFHRKSLT